MNKPQKNAQGLASLGRGEDTALVHMTPGEVYGLQSLAQIAGGSLTINPETGLPEAGFLSDILPALAAAAAIYFTAGAAAPAVLGTTAGAAGAAGAGMLGGGLTAGSAGMTGLGMLGTGSGLTAGAAGAASLAPSLGAGLTAAELATASAAAAPATSALLSPAITGGATGIISAGLPSLATNTAATTAGTVGIPDALGGVTRVAPPPEAATPPAGEPYTTSGTEDYIGPGGVDVTAPTASMTPEPSVWERGWEWAKKNPWPAASRAMMGMGLAGALFPTKPGKQPKRDPGKIRPYTYDPRTQRYTAGTPYAAAADGGLMSLAAGGSPSLRTDEGSLMSGSGIGPDFDINKPFFGPDATDTVGPDGKDYTKGGPYANTRGLMEQLNKLSPTQLAAQTKSSNPIIAGTALLLQNSKKGAGQGAYAKDIKDYTEKAAGGGLMSLARGKAAYAEGGDVPATNFGNKYANLAPVSPDAMNAYLANLNQSFIPSVEGLYKTHLGRASDPAGLAYWQNQFGAEVDHAESRQFAAAALPEIAAMATIPGAAPASTPASSSWKYNPATQTYTGPTTAAPVVDDGSGDDGSDTGDAYSNADAAGGSIKALAGGGLGSLQGTYAAGGNLLRGPGDGVSDSIDAVIQGAKPQRAALADGEFVIPSRIVSEIGNGSTEAGARRLYAMMDRIQKRRGKTLKNVAVDSKAHQLLPA